MENAKSVKILTRRRNILNFIREFGEVTIQQIQEAFKISHQTAWRDISALVQAGLVVNSKGRISIVARPIWFSFEPSLVKQKDRIGLSNRIGQAVNELIKKNEIVFIGPGEIPLSVALHLSTRSDLVLQICDLHQASILRPSCKSTLWILGGKVDNRLGYVTGGFALNAARRFRADTAIIGCKGISVDLGIFLHSFDSQLLIEEVLSNARKRILVTDPSSFNAVKVGNALPFTCIDQIITDAEVDPSVVEKLRSLGLELTLI